MHKKLGRWQKKVLERDQKFSWNLIDNPNQLHIQTIDSLCTTLTQQLPLLANFGTAPKITENPFPLYREAVQEVLSHIEENFAWSQALSFLLQHLDNDLNKLHELLINLLAKRDQWLPYIHFGVEEDEIKCILESHLSALIKDHLTLLATIFPTEWHAEMIGIACFAAQHVTNDAKTSALSACYGLQKMPGSDLSDRPIWQGIASLLLTKNFNWRKRFDAEIGFPPLTSFKKS